MISWELPRSKTIFIGSILFIAGLGNSCLGQPVDAPPCRMVLSGHRGPLRGFEPSADGRLVVSMGAKDGTVRIWDLSKGVQQRLITQERVEDKVRIWDNISATERRLILEESAGVADFGGRRRDRQNRAYDPASEPLPIKAALLSDNRRICMWVSGAYGLSTCPDEVVVYDLKTGGLQKILSAGGTIARENQISNCCFLPSKNILAISVISGSMHDANRLVADLNLDIYDLGDSRPIIRIHDGLDFNHYQISSDAHVLCTVTSSNLFTRNRRILNGRVALWDVRTGRSIARVRTDGRVVRGAWFSPSGRELAILGGADQNFVYICDIDTLEVSRTLEDFRNKPGRLRTPIGYLVYMPGGQYLIAENSDGTALFWDTKGYRRTMWMRLYGTGGTMIGFSADGRNMISTSLSGPDSTDGTLRVWDVEQILEWARGIRGHG